MTAKRQALIAWTITGMALLALIGPPLLAQTNVANSAVDLAGKILMVADSATGRTVTNLFTFDRGAAVPFAVGATSLKVTNLNADKLDDQTGSYYTTAANLTGPLPAIDGSALTGITAVPSGAIFYFNAACPTGYTEFTDARGRVISGLVSGGTLDTAVGSAFTNQENRTHTHTVAAHGHAFTGSASGVIDLAFSATSATKFGTFNSVASALNFGGTWWTDPGADWSSGPGAPNNFIGAASHTPAGTNATTALTTDATSGVIPYIQLRVCQKT